MIAARPTTYNGIRMRSRLEASVAAEFDHYGAQWIYEPRAYANRHGQYLPDFEVTAWGGSPLRDPVFVEVRPTVERAFLAMSRMPVIWDSEPSALLVIHVPGAIDFYAWGDRSRRWVTSEARG